MSPEEKGFEGGEIVEEIEAAEVKDPFQWLIPLTTLFLIVSLVLIFLELVDFYDFLGLGG